MQCVTPHALLHHAYINAVYQLMGTTAPRNSLATRYWLKQSTIMFTAAAHLLQGDPCAAAANLNQLDEDVSHYVADNGLVESCAYVGQA